MDKREEILNSIKNIEFDSNGDPLYSYSQMDEYASLVSAEKDIEILELRHLLSLRIKMEAAKDAAIKELIAFIEDADRSLYIGKDLNDIEILKWYINVWSTIKDEAKQLIQKYKQ